MPNIYRVISLSIVMSLFFAAPLLCVVPISTQIKEKENLAVNNAHPATARVVWNNGSYVRPRRFRAAAWARSVHRSREAGNELPLQEDNWTGTTAVSAGWHADNDDQHQDWDSADLTAEIDGIGSESPTSIYY
jgi:hypothetical protein